VSEGTASWRGTGSIRIGVSSCLLGAQVRYDGGHKRDRFLTDVLARYVEFVPVCPELEAGMGVPRPPVRLVRSGGEVRMLETASDRDHTARMRGFARRRVAALRGLDLCGYVLKRDSPSCGMERVKVYAPGAPGRREGRGLFAEALMAAFPHLPVEEEGRLLDPPLRENFVERVFAYRRLRDLFARRFTARELVAFHTAHKLQLMAHSPEAYGALGRLVAGQKRVSRAALRERYEAGFMAALARRATPGRNANALQHMAGWLRDGIDASGRAELAEAIHDYRRGLVPLVVPLTLVRHHARRLGVAYLLGQLYLEPHPKELMLRNHV
jgi:uncharacterized protein YbgA (DUF1722 family)/uncharacterized protein YbbK (DUF523 family)